MTKFGSFAAAVLCLCVALGLAGLHNARQTPIERTATISEPGWPQAAPPIKVALVSDIHIGNAAMDVKRLDAIVAQINEAKPDLILLAGDFVVGHGPSGIAPRAASLTSPLSKLKAPLGVIAILGNHDYWTSADIVRNALTASGITVLDNQAEMRGPITVIGISDRFSGHDQIAKAVAQARKLGGPFLVLTHSPDLAPDLPSDMSLVLAGHTHCGQVVLPLVGPLLTRAPFDHWRQLYRPEYRCGVVSDRLRNVIITGGVGAGTVPVRFGAPPDWWLIAISRLQKFKS